MAKTNRKEGSLPSIAILLHQKFGIATDATKKQKVLNITNSAKQTMKLAQREKTSQGFGTGPLQRTERTENVNDKNISNNKSVFCMSIYIFSNVFT